MKQHIAIDKATPNVGALDFSHLLDAPAGKHGHVTVKDGHFYFADGTRARFIGFNLPTRSNTPDHETADKLAARFASLGVNVIRLHAADAPIGDEPGSWSSCREAPLLDYESGTTRTFHPDGLDRFDYFWGKLKEHGIYLHIDLIVARAFQKGDSLDYPGEPGSCLKCYTMVNRRLIELQKEYAQKLLCHVNPYTGTRLLDDPAVMTLQINNEDSAIKGTADVKDLPGVAPYRKELLEKFGHFLLAKYGSREKLQKAWTYEGVCALGEDEDPAAGTVHIAEGGFVQPVNEPTGNWGGENSPARYADTMEFGIQLNRRFYREMKDFLKALGAKAPIATSNLLGGAADVYGHTDGDLMENNSYFNHPILPVQNNTYIVGGLQEYVSMNPLTMQQGYGAARTSLLSLGATAVVAGKPFVLSEWNEYGAYPFHSTAFVQMAAYACLNDWDGLILYAHHTSEKWNDQPAGEILNIFDAYNDPSLICQWGFLAEVFLKGLVAPASATAEIVYTQEDLLTLPNGHMMPNCFLPYVMNTASVFLDGGEAYTGSADVAVNAGFVNTGDLSQAKHGVTYAWSPWRDAFRQFRDESRLPAAAQGGEALHPGVTLGKDLVFADIQALSGAGDYRAFAHYLTQALHRWGVLPEDTGFVDGKLISQTGELVFDPDHAQFVMQGEKCAYFSGQPNGAISLGHGITAQVENQRLSLSALSLDGKPLASSRTVLLTAMGETGMDETTQSPVEFFPGVPFTACAFQGKLYADTWEGSLIVTGNATLTALDVYGNEFGEIPGETVDGKTAFYLSGDLPTTAYILQRE